MHAKEIAEKTTGKTLERALAEVAADEMRDLDEIRYYS